MMGYCRCSVKAYFPPYTDLSMRVRVPHVRIIHVVHIASPVRETARCYKHGNWSFELNDKCERRYCTAYQPITAAAGLTCGRAKDRLMIQPRAEFLRGRKVSKCK